MQLQQDHLSQHLTQAQNHQMLTQKSACAAFVAAANCSTCRATRTNHANRNLIINIVVCIAVGILGRLLPHLPNMTPFTALSIFAANNARGNRLIALAVVIIALIISDTLLAYMYGYPTFSLWTIFTYSGFAMITWCAKNCVMPLAWSSQQQQHDCCDCDNENSQKNNDDSNENSNENSENNNSKHGSKLFTLPCWIVTASLAYWLWTNLGVWLTSGIYAKNLAGLANCYVAALPFLQNAMLGDLIWTTVIFGAAPLLAVLARHYRYCMNGKACN